MTYRLRQDVFGVCPWPGGVSAVLSVVYVRTPRLFEELRIAHGDGSYSKRLSALAWTDLLILDDRVGTRATMITSQLPTEHLNAYLNDPTLADAILDRVLHAAHMVALSGESLRKQQQFSFQNHPMR